MSSTFHRLFRYARSTSADALENFTTEALAASIRADHRPFTEVLRLAGISAEYEEPLEMQALTQVGKSGAGVIDLVVQARWPDRLTEMWVEIKVHAAESGRQIDNYRAYIDAQPATTRPELITVSRVPIRTDPNLAWVPWQWLRGAGLRSASPYWTDLARFLEEIGMADDNDAAVSAREASSLKDAHRLLGKTARILWPVMQRAAATWPFLSWPNSEQALYTNLAVWFRNRGRFSAHLEVPGIATLVIGAWPTEGDADLRVTVETDPKKTALRDELLRAADAGGLPDRWTRHMAAWQGLEIRERLVRFPDHASAAAWVLAGLDELHTAGILELLPRLGRGEQG